MNLFEEKPVSIELDEAARILSITFSDARASKNEFKHTVEKIMRLGALTGVDPGFDTIFLKSNSPTTIKYLGDFLVKSFENFKKGNRSKAPEQVQAAEEEKLQVKCVYNEIEVMKFSYNKDTASFEW